MKLFNQLSLRNKITGIIVFTVLITLVTGFGIDLYSEINSIQNRSLSEKTLTTKIVSSYAVTDLVFDSPESALESLSYLKKDPSILNAYLYDNKGNIFVSLYSNENTYNINPDRTESWYEFDGDKLHIVEPILLDGNKIGSLYIHTSISDNLKNIEDRARTLIIIIILLTFLSFIIAGKLSKIVSDPLLSLTNSVKVYSQGKNYRLNLKSRHLDETGQLVEAFNEMITQISSNEARRDIADKKLKDNERNLNLILNNLVDGVIAIDENGIILSMNKAAEDMFLYTEDEIKGQNINLLMPKAIVDKNNEDLKTHLDTGIAKSIGIGRNLKAQRRNKEVFPTRLSVAELPRDLNGKRRFIGSCQDLTQLKQQELQIQRTQKMDALGKLTGGIAHDYNNMLGVVMGYSELLETSLNEQPTLKKYAHEIHRAGERGAKLTKKLLAFSRHQASEADIININALLLEEQHMLEKTLTVRIKLNFDLADDLWHIWLDSSDIEDAILNICINAMHAIEGNGQLNINTHNETINSLDAQILGIAAGDYITISIADTGCGMSDEVKEKIFDPFYSTKGDKGTGLGLSQVYGFVKHNGGAIKVYSELNQGTQFKLYFPRYFSTVDGVKSKENKHTNNLEGFESILVVDDEKALRHLSFDILSSQGYQVVCAKDGEHALNILKTKSFDLMISDVIMPGMDGYQLSAIAKEKYPLMKIQLASGFADDRHPDTVDANLRENILHKPYNSSSLLQRIRDLLD
jgi:PAS domain S-box-containing protein